jgi:hypothetical protein
MKKLRNIWEYMSKLRIRKKCVFWVEKESLLAFFEPKKIVCICLCVLFPLHGAFLQFHFCFESHVNVQAVFVLFDRELVV